MSNRKSTKNQGKRKQKQEYPSKSKTGGSFKEKNKGNKVRNNAWDEPMPTETMLGTREVSDSMQEPLVFENDTSK